MILERTERPALQPRKSPRHLSRSGPQPRSSIASLETSSAFPVFQPSKKETCTFEQCCLRGMASSAFAAICET